MPQPAGCMVAASTWLAAPHSQSSPSPPLQMRWWQIARWSKTIVFIWRKTRFGSTICIFYYKNDQIDQFTYKWSGTTKFAKKIKSRKIIWKGAHPCTSSWGPRDRSLLIGWFLLRLSDFSLVGNIIVHGRILYQTKRWNSGLPLNYDLGLIILN